MNNVIPMRKPRDHHGEALERALAIDPYWTKERLEEASYACRDVDDDLHIECAGDPDFMNRVRESM